MPVRKGSGVKAFILGYFLANLGQDIGIPRHPGIRAAERIIPARKGNP